MRKLVSLEIENFQAHAHTVINFNDGVTVLCGETDQGKTAVLRALTWLVTNRPAGIGFVSHWAKTVNSKGTVAIKPDKRCAVKLELLGDDGAKHVVERVRTATENKYVVDGKALSAVGSDVPPDVTTLLGMKGVNRQSQEDGYFFLTQTAGQMAASLNELVHLDTIDEAYGYVHRRKVETNVLYKEANIAQTGATHELTKLRHIPEMRSLYNEAQEYAKSIDEKQRVLLEINALLNKLAEVHRALAESVPNVERKLMRMGALCEDLAAVESEAWDISAFLQKVGRVEEALAEFPTVAEGTLAKMQKFIENWHKALADYEKVSDIWSDIEVLDNAIARCKDELEGLEKELPEVCPLCGAKIGDCAHDREAKTAT